MNNNANHMIHLTDGKGRPLVCEEDRYEPEIDSVCLTRGEHGLAWQRFRRDGLWHQAGSNSVRNWWAMMQDRDLILIYEAEPRDPEHKREPRACQPDPWTSR